MITQSRLPSFEHNVDVVVMFLRMGLHIVDPSRGLLVVGRMVWKRVGGGGGGGWLIVNGGGMMEVEVEEERKGGGKQRKREEGGRGEEIETLAMERGEGEEGAEDGRGAEERYGKGKKRGNEGRWQGGDGGWICEIGGRGTVERGARKERRGGDGREMVVDEEKHGREGEDRMRGRRRNEERGQREGAVGLVMGGEVRRGLSRLKTGRDARLGYGTGRKVGRERIRVASRQGRVENRDKDGERRRREQIGEVRQGRGRSGEGKARGGVSETGAGVGRKGDEEEKRRGQRPGKRYTGGGGTTGRESYCAYCYDCYDVLLAMIGLDFGLQKAKDVEDHEFVCTTGIHLWEIEICYFGREDEMLLKIKSQNHNLWDIIVDRDLQEEAAPAREQPGPPAPKTAKQLTTKRNQEKVKSILLLAIPDEYLLKFRNVSDAKSLWAAIKSRFGGNDESKKMQRNVLKHQFENFTTTPNESLDKAYDRFQKLISQLEVHAAPVSKEDINQKFLIRSLYNNLRVYEDEMKRSLSSTSNSQNLAFLSFENTNNTNEVSPASRNFRVNTAGGTNSSSQVSSTPGADEVLCSFFAQQTNSPLLDNEDLQQIDQDDLEELAIRWQVAILNVRVKGHFAKECKSGWNQGKRSYGDNGRRNATTNEPSSQALVAQDGPGGYDWSNDFDEPVNYALMAISSSSSSSSSDNE
ncbi:hypothetical protein Tco_1400076, partial [Tanacetum coccineum]